MPYRLECLTKIMEEGSRDYSDDVSRTSKKKRLSLKQEQQQLINIKEALTIHAALEEFEAIKQRKLKEARVRKN